jgi:hypothetical protein
MRRELPSLLWRQDERKGSQTAQENVVEQKSDHNPIESPCKPPLKLGIEGQTGRPVTHNFENAQAMSLPSAGDDKRRNPPVVHAMSFAMRAVCAAFAHTKRRWFPGVCGDHSSLADLERNFFFRACRKRL